MAIWNNKNSAISNNHKCTSVDMIEQARHMFIIRFYILKILALVCQLTSHGRISIIRGKRKKLKHGKNYN